MPKTFSQGRLHGPLSIAASVLCSMLLVFAVVEAATTISTNINTGGTLTVTGAGHLQGDLNIYGNDFNLGTGTATSTLSGGFGVGVGTTTPGAAFAVATSTAGLNTAFLLSNLGSNYTFYAEDVANDGSPFVIDAAGNVGVGTTTPGVKLGIAGDINANAIYGDTLFATSTTATSTLRGGLTVDTDTLIADFSSNKVSAASTSPWGQFSIESIKGTVGASTPIFVVGDQGTTSPFLMVSGNDGRVGIASSSPFVTLGITGTTTSSAGAILGINGSPVNQIRFGACTLDPGFIQASSTLIVSCTGATGVTATDNVFITATKLEYGLSLVSASSTAVDAISIAVHNNANASTSGTFGSGIDPISTSVFWMAIK